jgi:hypothetical protein
VETTTSLSRSWTYDWLEWSADGLNTPDTVSSRHIREVDSGKWAEFVDGTSHQVVLVFGQGQFGVVLRVHAQNTANLDLLTAVAVDKFQRLP